MDRNNEMVKKLNGVLKPGLVYPSSNDVARNTGIVFCALCIISAVIFVMDTAIVGLLALV